MNPESVKIVPEFGHFPIDDDRMRVLADIRLKFNNLLLDIVAEIPKGNERYAAIVRTKLEESCLFAIKAVTKPGNVN